MKILRLLLLLSGLAGSGVIARAQFTWTGLDANGDDISNPGNWRGGTPPTFDGTEDLVFGKAINSQVSLSGDIAVNSITTTGTDSYRFSSGTTPTITIGTSAGSGLYGSLTGTGSILLFDTSIDFTSAGTITIDAGNSTLAIAGKINGSMDVILTNLRGGNGSIIFNDTCTGSTYTGNTTITGIAGTPVVVAFWNDHPFGDGTGTLTVDNAAQLIAHGASRTVSNPIIFDTADTVFLKSWDDVLTFSGAVTLASNMTLSEQRGTPGLASYYTTGVYPLSGPMTRNPIVFSGPISGGYGLVVTGGGILELTGTNTYTGGTTAGGSVVFGSSASTPSSGSVVISLTGYAGDAAPLDFASFLTHINVSGSTGSIGLDSLPGTGTNTFSDAINLSSFTSPNIRIGSATSAILTGTITPQGTNYQFGNGGGTLYVQSGLVGSRGLTMNNSSVVALTLYLQGNNNYIGGTSVANGFVIFDGPTALPGSGALTASGSNDSYIGYTDSLGISAAAFLTKFNKPSTNGIIGFDTNATTFGATGATTIGTAIDLSTFNNGVFIGTATGAILTGAITPTPDHILRLTATHGSNLEIDSPLTGSLALVLGATGFDAVYSDGTVFLPYANTYTGGTTLNSTTGGITLLVGDNSSLGTGPLNIPQGALGNLQASGGGLQLANNVVFAAGATPGQLFFTGNGNLQLNGIISGPGSLNIMDPSASVLNVGGNNTFTGDVNLYNGTLQLFSDNGAGMGTINFLNSASVLGAYTTNPIIYGISGEDGSVLLNDGQALTINTSDSTHTYRFGGTIGNETPPNASLTVTSSTGGNTLYLYGNNNYTAGTFIGTGGTDHASLAIGNAQALGSGTVTLNGAGPSSGFPGALAVNAGTTFGNNLVFTSGTLQGFGTFSPSSGQIVFGTNQGVVAGVYGIGNKAVPGTLTITSGVDFANGGSLLWVLQDRTRPDGHGLLVADTGNLNISATAGGFTVYMASVDSTGLPGTAANLIYGANNAFAIATTTNGATITNFNAADFSVDTSLFADPVTSVYFTSDGTNLFLNFTPVPEPSTYALLGLGLGAVLFPALRRRKRV